MAQKRRKSRNYRPAQVSPAAPANDVDDDGAPLLAVARRSRRLANTAAAAAPRPGARVEPTPEQLRTGNYRLVRTKDPHSAAPIEVRRNMVQSSIDRWFSRGLLTGRQLAAASRYRDDYERGGYERSVISRYDGGGGSGDGTPNMSGLLAANMAQLDARRRVAEARAVMPIRLRGYFDALVLHDASADTIGAEAGRAGNARAVTAMLFVQVCADILGDYYRLPE